MLGLTALAVTAALVMSNAPLIAQEDGAVPVSDPTAFLETDDTGEIDALLEGEDEMLADSGYLYDPAGRRDPFKSLVLARDRIEMQGPRPEGIPGLLVDEIDLTGIFLTSEGPVAQVQSADQDRSFLIHENEQLYDGVVIQITDSEIVFKQYVDDPTALKPFREVVKKLNP
jgi:hypothetical protein